LRRGFEEQGVVDVVHLRFDAGQFVAGAVVHLGLSFGSLPVRKVWESWTKLGKLAKIVKSTTAAYFSKAVQATRC
jgi:hypothetical protein